MAETVVSLRVQVTITGTVVGDNGTESKPIFSYDRTMSDGTGTDGVGNWFYNTSRF